MKSGTTFLRRTISEHPDIFMVNPTEPRFFYHDTNFEKGVDWYMEWFKESGDSKIIGESSGLYSHCEKFPMTAQRMHMLIPNCKIIYLVRNPIERLKSHWAWDISNGRAIGNINIAVREQNYLIEQSKYFKQIKAYRNFFPDHKIKVLFMEDMITNEKFFLKDVWKFLDVDASYIPQKIETNKNKTEGRITDSERLIKYRRLFPNNTCKIVPPYLKNLMKTTKKPSSDLSINSMSYISDHLKVDTEKFLEYSGKPKHFWNITD